MEKIKSLTFHYGFYPELQHISEILMLTNSGFVGNKDQIMDETGIPTGKSSGKVEPAILYAEYMGLINSEINESKYNFSFTELGKKIFQEDRYLSDNITKMILHYLITDRRLGAEQWKYMFKDINKKCGEKHNLKVLNQKGKIQYDARSLDFKPVLDSYKKEGCFKSLNLIEFGEGEITFKSNSIDYDFVPVYAYVLLDLWDRYLNGRAEITIDELVDELEIGKVFGFDREEILYMLNEIEVDGAIKVNKQLSPIIIQRLAEKSEYIDRLYESAI